MTRRLTALIVVLLVAALATCSRIVDLTPPPDSGLRGSGLGSGSGEPPLDGPPLDGR